jgi:hypothetical protein
MKSILCAPWFLLDLFCNGGRPAVGLETRVHDTGAGMNFKLPKVQGAVLVFGAWRRARRSTAG